MSVIGQRIDEIICLDLALRLKARGYKKQARTFHRAGSAHVLVVNIQGSKWNAGDSGTFTINLGVYFPAARAGLERTGDRLSANSGLGGTPALQPRRGAPTRTGP